MDKQCVSCGSPLIEKDAAFCSKCGSPQEPLNKVTVNIQGNVNQSEIYAAGENLYITQEGLVQCPSCFGTGYEHQECPRCTGTGKLKYYSGPKNKQQSDNILEAIFLAAKELFDETREYNYSYQDCGKCNGKGRLQLSDPDDLRSYTEALVLNTSTGRVYQKRCPTCLGSGKVRLSHYS